MNTSDDTRNPYSHNWLGKREDSKEIVRVFNPGQHLPVAFDIDGIVLDTATEMWRTITTHLDLPWSMDKWVHYDIGKIVGVPVQDLRPVYEPVLDNHRMPAIEGAIEALSALYYEFRKPILFITSRRSEFKEAAVESLRWALPSDVEFEVLCTGDILSEEHRNNKLSLLQDYQVKLFVEDNYLHWESYIDSGIQVITLKWPWTIHPYLDIRDKGKVMRMFSDWDSMLLHIRRWLSAYLYTQKIWYENRGVLTEISRIQKFLSTIKFECDKCGYKSAGDENLSFKYLPEEPGVITIKCPKCGEW